MQPSGAVQRMGRSSHREAALRRLDLVSRPARTTRLAASGISYAGVQRRVRAGRRYARHHRPRLWARGSKDRHHRRRLGDPGSARGRRLSYLATRTQVDSQARQAVTDYLREQRHTEYGSYVTAMRQIETADARIAHDYSAGSVQLAATELATVNDLAQKLNVEYTQVFVLVASPSVHQAAALFTNAQQHSRAAPPGDLAGFVSREPGTQAFSWECHKRICRKCSA